MFVASQIMGAIAGLCLLPSYFTKNKVVVLLCGILANIMFALQFFFLKAYTGAIINFILILPVLWYFVYNNTGKKIPMYVLIVCECVAVVCTAITWVGWVSVLPLVASIIYTYSTWQDNLLVYKWLSIVNTICWDIYAIINVSPVTIIIESILVVSNIVAIIIAYKNKNENADNIVE